MPDPETVVLQVPPPALRRPAPARDDRAVDLVRSGAAHRRRADHGAGCDGAGRDPRAAAQPAQAARQRDHPHHPRHGRRRRPRRPHHGDEGRRRRRDRHGAGHLRAAEAPVHPGAARRRAAPGHRDAARSTRRWSEAEQGRPHRRAGAEVRERGDRVPEARTRAGVPRGRGHRPGDLPGRDRRPGGRVRLGQDHARPRIRRPAPDQGGQAHGRRRRHLGRRQQDAEAASAARRASCSRTRDRR